MKYVYFIVFESENEISNAEATTTEPITTFDQIKEIERQGKGLVTNFILLRTENIDIP